MKVEVISIGTELLVSDILDTNAAYISRSLREAQATMTCKVTVGDDSQMIADVLRVGLSRADVVLTTGGLGQGTNDFTLEAIAACTGRRLLSDPPGVEGAMTLGDLHEHGLGILLELESGILVALPGNRREMAYLLETNVLPYLRRRVAVNKSTGRIILRTIGVMESSLKQELAELKIGPNHRITFESFAGQTNIRVWVEADSEQEVDEELGRLKQLIIDRLGDHVYGMEADRLENVVLSALRKSSTKLALAECYTKQTLAKALTRVPGAQTLLTLVPTSTWNDLANYLQLDNLTQDNLTQWCREAAEALLSDTGADLGLIVYSNVTQGGVQILVTLASPYGVSVTQRSFGGHPDNIDQWALTLGLSHLRRWLLVHQ